MFAKKLTKVRRDALNDRVNGIDMFINGLNGVTREQVENQQTGSLVIISAISKVLVALAEHQFVQGGLSWFNAFDRRLGREDDRFAIVFHDAFQTNIVIENPILESDDRGIRMGLHRV
jgi:hypothetical protein